MIIKFPSYATTSDTHSSFLISAWLATNIHLIALLCRIILEKVMKIETLDFEKKL